ncbi:unnamed protein product [Echinostoma caproni]|uniref:Uncharacterized protein n=1 Tax=Echinostoma caproni TaxID=27848 RepID=A0A183AHM9_9TREM|nr:unnamed protein product [Echinostoma caproni]
MKQQKGETDKRASFSYFKRSPDSPAPAEWITGTDTAGVKRASFLFRKRHQPQWADKRASLSFFKRYIEPYEHEVPAIPSGYRFIPESLDESGEYDKRASYSF